MLLRSAKSTAAAETMSTPSRAMPTRVKKEASSPLVSRFTWKAARRRMGTLKNPLKRKGTKAMAREIIAGQAGSST